MSIKMSKYNFCGFVAFVFLLVAIKYSYAQDKTYLGIQASLQHTFLREKTRFKPKSTIGYNAGIILGYQVSERIVVNFGINYSRQGQNFNYNRYPFQPWGESRLEIKLHYTKMQILFDYKIKNTDSYYISIFGGSAFSFLLTAKDNFKENYAEEILLRDTEYNRFDISALIGINLHLILSSNFGFNIRIGEEYGFMNIFKDTNSTTENKWVNFYEAKNNVVSISFGIIYTISK